MVEYEVVSEPPDQLGESPLWVPEEAALYWLDLPSRRVRRRDEATGRVSSHDAAVGEDLACLLRGPDGLILASATRFWSLAGDGGMELLRNGPAAGDPRVCLNDGKVDRHGALWIGSSDRAEAEPLGALWRLGRDDAFQEVDRGFIVANGPAFSPDGRRAYFADTFADAIYVYDLDDGGRPVRRETFVSGGAPGYPDGLTTDLEGRVYSCRWGGGGVAVFRADGAEDRFIPLQVANVTSCAFGGAKLRDLYVTTASDGLATSGGGSRAGRLHRFSGIGTGLAESRLRSSLGSAPGLQPGRK